jgi:hypothetical protein
LREPARLSRHVWKHKRYTKKHGRTSNVDPDNMHPQNKTDKGRHLSPASYALTKAEKEIFFEVLSSIKVPSGFSSNIK